MDSAKFTDTAATTPRPTEEPAMPPAPSSAPRKGFALGVGLTVVLAIAAYMLATLPVLNVIGTLSVALLLGIAWRATAGLPAGTGAGIKFSAKTLLRLGIVLLGARLNYGLVMSAGPKILLIDVAVIVVGITVIYWLAKRFGLPRDLSMLMAVGTSICGASAVAAASTVTKSDESTTTLAVAMMGILGTLGVFFYIAVAPVLGLSNEALGVLSGSTLHEVAQVMAAAFTWGTESGDMGTLVKLTRVVMLAPALLVVGYFFHRGSAGGGLKYSWKEPPIPYFVLGFLVLGGVNSLGWLAPVVQNVLTQASIFLMALAMAGMGLNTDLKMIRKTGWGAVYAGVIGFLGLAAMAFGMIKVLGVA